MTSRIESGTPSAVPVDQPQVRQCKVRSLWNAWMEKQAEHVIRECADSCKDDKDGSCMRFCARVMLRPLD
jgi:hypothetical protein